MRDDPGGKVITSTGNFNDQAAVLDVVIEQGGIPVGIGMLVDRSGGKASFGEVPYKALLNLDVTTYDPSDCPLCKQNIPMTKRGSRKL